MPLWQVMKDGQEVKQPEGSNLNLVFTSAEDLTAFLNTVIQPLAHSFGYEIILKKKGLPVVKPG
jgi:hypothetical protein